LVFAILFAVMVLLSGCPNKGNVVLPVAADFETNIKAEAAAQDPMRMNLRVGVVPGPYADMFTHAIQPSLEKMGYTVRLEYYNNYTLPNISLARNLIDLNMYQHYRSLNDFNFENDLALSAIAEIPTLSMGIFSLKYTNIRNINKGITISLPSDSANLSRALCLLADANLIVLDSSVNKRKAALVNITGNPHNLKFAPLRSENLVQSLSISEMSIMDGNYAISGGLSLSNELYREKMDIDYLNVIAVRTEDLSRQFVQDIIRVLRSDEYRSIIMDSGGKYAGFQKPPSILNAANK
jgi:D-methionine transport system substrate-binding protein